MAKWFKEYLGFGNRRSPPRPPKPDYTESEILRAYRAQKSLDFEDPYEEKECTVEHPRSPARFGPIQEANLAPRKRLIKVEQIENNWSSRSRLGATLDADDMTKVTVGNEYSDPFDVTKKGILENNEVENASYMEPYENQGSFTGIESPTRSKLDRGLQLYDSPYEERYQRFFKECRQPSDDERPADEYDQPWEWKKEGISRAFAEQFEGSAWQHRSPTSRVLLLQSESRSPDTPQRKNTSSINLIEKEMESSSKDRVCALTEPTNGSSLCRQEWYHGTMSHEDAEKLLSEVNLGSFLLRTENDSFHYISVRGFHSVLHIKVAIAQDGRFQLADSGPTFSCILDLIQHYIQSPLLVPGEGHLSLQCPVSSIER